MSQPVGRATRAGIWTATTSCPSGVRISTLLRSLSWLAAASSADLYSPGRCTTDTTSPLIGVRWTWAGKIDRKMLIRGSGRSGRLSSAGGTAFSTRQINPSAGATTRPGRVGGTRGGWRKNAALTPAVNSPALRSHRLRRPAAATAMPAPTKGRPAGCIGGIVVLARATSRAGPDLRSGRLAIVSRFYGWLPARQVPNPHSGSRRQLHNVLVDLQQTVRRRQPAQMMRRGGPVAADRTLVGVQHATPELSLAARRLQILGQLGCQPWSLRLRKSHRRAQRCSNEDLERHQRADRIARQRDDRGVVARRRRPGG